jgi:hypothetical protein
MEQFVTARQAKEYLIERILRQAGQNGISLTDVERKMLYFSEAGWTLSDMMAISQEFDRAYNQDEYERKIGQIIRRIHDQPKTNRDEDRWDEAVQCLREEDHYLLVLIDGALSSSAKRPHWDTARLILAGVVIVAAFFPILFFIDSHVSDPALSKLIGQSAFLALVVLVAFLLNRGYRRSS